jgi:hypothetical protein
MLKTLFNGVAIDDWSAAPAPSLIDRIKGLFAARRDNTDDVAKFIEDHGGVLTDSLEREISRRFGGFAGR